MQPDGPEIVAAPPLDLEWEIEAVLANGRRVTSRMYGFHKDVAEQHVRSFWRGISKIVSLEMRSLRGVP